MKKEKKKKKEVAKTSPVSGREKLDGIVEWSSDGAMEGPACRGSPCSKEVDKRVASALPLQAFSCIDPHNSGGSEGVGAGWVAEGGLKRVERRLAGLSPTSTAEKRMRRGWLERRKKGRSKENRSRVTPTNNNPAAL